MRTSKLALIGGALSLLAGTSANANLLHLETYFLEGALSGTGSETTFVEDESSVSPLTYLNKYGEEDDVLTWVDDGALSNDSGYFSIDLPLEDDGEPGSTGSVQWDLTGSGWQLRYVLVKDGTMPERGHLYSLFEVTPDQYLASGGWQGICFGADCEHDKGISHVSFFGERGGSTKVPEPSSLLLLGASLLSFGLVRRRWRLS